MPIDQNGNFYISAPASPIRINPYTGEMTLNVGGINMPIKSNKNTPIKSNEKTAGSMFQGTGIYAPRRRVGSADSMARAAGVSAETNTSGGTNTFIPSGTDWRQQNPDYVEPARRLSVQAAGDQILAGLDGMGGSSSGGYAGGGGGGGGNPYTNAIRILQQQLDGGQYGTSYDNLSTLLGTTSGTARGQIDQATADAIAQINSRDGLATPINYSAGATQIPQTALNNYLNAIGSSTGTVDAGRNFLQGLIDTSASSASQAQASQQQAYAAQRQAAIDALTGNQQLQQGNLASSTQAQQMAIARAKEQERKALQDQILQYILKGGRA